MGSTLALKRPILFSQMSYQCAKMFSAGLIILQGTLVQSRVCFVSSFVLSFYSFFSRFVYYLLKFVLANVLFFSQIDWNPRFASVTSPLTTHQTTLYENKAFSSRVMLFIFFKRLNLGL